MKYVPGMNYGEMVDALIEADTEEKAKEFYDSYVAWLLNNADMEVRTPERCHHLASVNLGYLAGYAPTRINREVWDKLIRHPIYGSIKNLGSDNANPPLEE